MLSSEPAGPPSPYTPPRGGSVSTGPRTSPHTRAGGSREDGNTVGAQPPHPQAPWPLPAGPARRRRRRRRRGKALQCCCSVSKAMRHDGCSSRRGHRAALKPRSWGRAPAPSPPAPRAVRTRCPPHPLGPGCTGPSLLLMGSAQAGRLPEVQPHLGTGGQLPVTHPPRGHRGHV